MKIIGQQLPRTSELANGKPRETDRLANRPEEGRSTEKPIVSQRKAPLTMQRVKDAIQRTPDVRQERVQSLKQQIQRGDYNVDADSLASKLLNTHLREDIDTE